MYNSPPNAFLYFFWPAKSSADKLIFQDTERPKIGVLAEHFLDDLSNLTIFRLSLINIGSLAHPI